MRLFDRLALSLKADAHGVMDQLEERSLLLKQHLREAEIELDRSRARLQTLEEEERCLEEEAERLAKNVSSLDEDVSLAMAGDKQDLARYAVSRLLPERDALARVNDRMEQLRERRGRLAEQLDGRESQFEDLRHRVQLRLATPPDRRDESPIHPRVVADEEIELELLRRRESTASGAKGDA